ncbi:MAG: hypothetical protein AB1611_06695 [bacterium]
MNKDAENEVPQLPSLFYLEKFYTLGLMTHRIAHEINNSIQGILLLLNFLETDYSQDENIALLSQEIHEIKRFIHSILSYVRATRPDFEPMDLAALIRETINLLQGLTGDQAFAGIIAHYPPSGPLMVKGNFYCLQLALLSLLLLCGQRQQAGCQNLSPIEVDASPAPSGQKHTIQIRFPGRLVSNENLSLPADAGEPRFSLVQRILHLHQGEFQTLDESGGNSCFIITLPAAGCQE